MKMNAPGEAETGGRRIELGAIHKVRPRSRGEGGLKKAGYSVQGGGGGYRPLRTSKFNPKLNPNFAF